MRHVIAWSIRSIRERGLWTTLHVAATAATDVFFDLRFRTDTNQAVNTDALGVDSANVSHAKRYKPTKARPFKKLLRRLHLPPDAVFVDYGSGKGRVLMLAARQHFKRVVGIEFSPGLCATARRNIDLFRAKVANLAPIEVVERDATAYRVRDDDSVFYFCNPFDDVVLVRAMEQIRQSVAAHPRPIWVIYAIPLHADLLDRMDLFRQQETFTFGGMQFRVYSNP